MPVNTFNPNQPWGTAEAHQREHPAMWTPDLIEATNNWVPVVRAIVQAQVEIAAGQPSSFIGRCHSDAAFRENLTQIVGRGLHSLLVSWVMEGVKERLHNLAVPNFWNHYKEVENTAPRTGYMSKAYQRRLQSAFFAAVTGLSRYVHHQLQLVSVVDGANWNKVCSHGVDFYEQTAKCKEIIETLQAYCLALAPDREAFSTWLTVTWQRSFVDVSRGESVKEVEEEDGEESEEEAEAWEAEGEDEEGEEGAAMVVDDAGEDTSLPPVAEPLRACCAALHHLCWLPMVEPTLSAMLHLRLHASLIRRCAKHFDERMLHRVLAWLRKGVTRWLRTVLMPNEPFDTQPSPQLQQWLARIRFFLMQALATLRISELFDMIVDYPDSLPALNDLKACLEHTHQHEEAVKSLQDAIESRLLKPGTNTENIIQVYVAAIKALRHLDPTGVTLEAVSDRVRTYLKARSDTIRQIVTSLTDPETSELLEPGTGEGGAGTSGEGEAMKDDGGLDGDDVLDVDIDELKGDEAAMMEWTPDPVKADPSRSSSRRTTDVLSILVNIYGSKALFVNEFRSMLADKLLNASDYETDREVRNLELLKKRFGETALSSCEVMLRDIAESRRVTRAVQRHFGDENAKVLDATIVSRLCWPLLPTDTFELPPKMATEMSRFEKQFMHSKAPRKLVWKPSLGCVTLDVEFADKKIKAVKCSPLHATILVTFGEQPKWSLSALAAKLKVAPEILKKRMVLWINRGFILEVGRTPEGDINYEAPTHLGAGADKPQMGDEEEDGGGGGGGAAEAQLEAEMRVYEQYVIGMLTNLESLPLGRIHNMLRMFVPAQGTDRGYDRSEAELQRFLNRLVEDGKLEVSAGQFKIRRAS